MATEHFRRIKEYADSHGWSCTRQARSSNHRFSKEGCRPIFVSLTASDRRATKNAIAEMKRAERAAEGERHEPVPCQAIQ